MFCKTSFLSINVIKYSKNVSFISTLQMIDDHTYDNYNQSFYEFTN